MANCERVGNRRMAGHAMIHLGYALTMLGRSDDALDVLARASVMAERSESRGLALAAKVARIRALADRVDAEQLAAEAWAAAEQAEREGLMSLASQARLQESRARLRCGQHAQARSAAERAMTIRREYSGLAEDEAELFVAHARALIAGDRKRVAKSTVDEGLRRVRAVAERIGNPELRNRFLAVGAHRELEELEAMLA